jgi:hypothetical protein
MAYENTKVVTRQNASEADKAVSTADVYVSNSRFLKAADLKGKSVVVEIEGYELGAVGDPPKPQIILHFKDREKVLGLNVGNKEAIEGHTGSRNPFDWLGWKIRLFTTMDSFQGRQFECIRISREFSEPPVTAASENSADDVINF